MKYQVLARKWRPRSFPQVVGQEHVLRALINALDNNRLHHAYLFTGTRGVGKTTLGRILAKSLNCELGVTSSPCGTCSACTEIDEGRFVDLLEVDAASRTKVEDTRDLLENVQYAPTRGRFKVYLIDEVHMLSNHSFNALLKTLEEPPPHVKFVLATTDPQKLPVTILSRCLKFNLKCIPVDQIQGHLAYVLDQEGLSYEPAALKQIARAASGSMRDALSLLDQAIAHGAGKVDEAEVKAMLGTMDRQDVRGLLDALMANDGPNLLKAIDKLAQFGVDFQGVLAEFISLLHGVAMAQVIGSEALDEEDIARQYAAKISPEDIQLFYQIGLQGRRDLPLAPDLRAGFEMLMVRMLAFRPVIGQESKAVPPPVREESASPASAAVIRTQPTAPVEPPRVREEAPVAQAAPTPPRTHPAAAMQSLREQLHSPQPPQSEFRPEIESSPQGLPANLNWRAAVDSLNLMGMLKQLSIHCALQEQRGNKLLLSIASEHSHLVSKQRMELLQQALEKRYGTSIILNIQVGEVGQQTPAAMQAEADAERMREAVEKLESDPAIKAMKQTFDAQVDPKSIRLQDS